MGGMENSLMFRYGALIALVLILYFLALSAVDLHLAPGFSLFNGMILGAGMYFGMRHFKRVTFPNFTYTNGFAAGLGMGSTATFLFTLFFWVYATEISPTFLDELLASYVGSQEIGTGMVIFTVGIMGLSSTLVLALTLMQGFKVSNNLSVPNS